jgi:acetylornithine deacetylase/succinyl-diaminopimelate desuccinylase-like protein
VSPARRSLAIALALTVGLAAEATGADLTPHQTLGRELLRTLVEIDTTAARGDTTLAAEAMARRLLEAGLPADDIQVVGPRKRNRNLVARLRGTGRRRPVLLLAHLDVVEARRDDWSVEPFRLLEREGFFYGRGTSDIKDGAAILVATLIRLREENLVPDRDLVLALTAGEESGDDYNGVEWLLAQHRDLVDAAFCVNMDSGDPQLLSGKRRLRPIQASEKVYMTLRLEVTSPGGHSSIPVKDNAIYRLAAALGRVEAFEFPARLNEVTRAYFEGLARAPDPPAPPEDLRAVTLTPPDPAAVARLSAVPYFNAQLRTTCVATMLDAGHAENALPQRARATVNCRMLPDEHASEVEAAIRGAVADRRVEVSAVSTPVPGPPSPLSPEIMEAVEQTTAEVWPGVPVIPVMETGATDGKYFRRAGIPTYGVSGVFLDMDDVRAHGRDERIGVQDYYDGLEYTYRLVRALSGLSGVPVRNPATRVRERPPLVGVSTFGS